MTSAQETPGVGLVDQLQPDGNFRDDPSSPEEIEALRRSQDLERAKEANRVGPSHPAHERHGEWLAERGLGPGPADDGAE